MEKPFPELTDLSFPFPPEGEEIPILPHSFLGGSAAHLRKLLFDGVPPLVSQNLLLSANNLVSLSLRSIPDSGYLNLPEDVATCLSGLTRLETLILQFWHRPSYAVSEPSPQLIHPLTPSVLPTLTRLEFQGRSYYLERLVARIDAPLLLRLYISFLHNDIFDVPQLRRFISHAQKFSKIAQARLYYYQDEPLLDLRSLSWTVDDPKLVFYVSGRMKFAPYFPLSSLARICESSFPLISTVGGLFISGVSHYYHDPDDRRNQRNDWAELLDLFTSLTTLFLKVGNGGMATPIMDVLLKFDEESERALLPALQDLYIEDLQSYRFHDLVTPFVTTRQLSDRHVAVYGWEP